ncbi:predicted protein [Postia placenta Mad-698-R]|nr:predicted protein [Postia placenta Mad-698-R]
MVKYIKNRERTRRELLQLWKDEKKAQRAPRSLPSSLPRSESFSSISASSSSKLRDKRLLPRSHYAGGLHKPIKVLNWPSPQKRKLSPRLGSTDNDEILQRSRHVLNTFHSSEEERLSLLTSFKERVVHTVDEYLDDKVLLNTVRGRPKTPVTPHRTPEHKRRQKLLQRSIVGRILQWSPTPSPRVVQGSPLMQSERSKVPARSGDGPMSTSGKIPSASGVISFHEKPGTRPQPSCQRTGAANSPKVKSTLRASIKPVVPETLLDVKRHSSAPLLLPPVKQAVRTTVPARDIQDSPRRKISMASGVHGSSRAVSTADSPAKVTPVQRLPAVPATKHALSSVSAARQLPPICGATRSHNKLDNRGAALELCLTPTSMLRTSARAALSRTNVNNLSDMQKKESAKCIVSLESRRVDPSYMSGTRPIRHLAVVATPLQATVQTASPGTPAPRAVKALPSSRILNHMKNGSFRPILPTPFLILMGAHASLGNPEGRIRAVVMRHGMIVRNVSLTEPRIRPPRLFKLRRGHCNVALFLKASESVPAFVPMPPVASRRASPRSVLKPTRLLGVDKANPYAMVRPETYHGRPQLGTVEDLSRSPFIDRSNVTCMDVEAQMLAVDVGGASTDDIKATFMAPLRSGDISIDWESPLESLEDGTEAVHVGEIGDMHDRPPARIDQVYAGNFTFDYGDASQCDDFSVSWSGGTAPYQLTLIPVFYGRTLNYTIPSSSYSNGQGSYKVQLPFPENQTVIAVMSDANGFATGGVSDVITTGPSISHSHISTLVNQKTQAHDAAGREYSFSNYTGAMQPATITGIIPGGETFVLNPPTGPPDFEWIANIKASTSMLFLMVDSKGRQGGSTPIDQVGVTNDATCLTGSYPSSLAVHPSATFTSSSASATSTSTPSGSSSKSSVSGGAIAGGVIGGIVGLAAIALLAYYFLRRNRRTRGRFYDDGVYQAYRAGRSKKQNVDLVHETSEDAPPAIVQPYPLFNPSEFGDGSDLGAVSSVSNLIQPGSHPGYMPYTHSTHSRQMSDGTSAFPESMPGLRDSFSSSSNAQSISSGARRKAAMAGMPAYQPPARFILHTDAEDVIELPPQYSAFRAPSATAQSADEASTSGDDVLPPPPPFTSGGSTTMPLIYHVLAHFRGRSDGVGLTVITLVQHTNDS